MQKKVIEYLKKTENPYILKVGNMAIELRYSENDRRFNECMKNILKRKKQLN